MFTRAGHYYWWVPVVGPHAGAIIGAWIYHVVIARGLVPAGKDTKSSTDFNNTGDRQQSLNRSVKSVPVSVINK